MESNSKEEFNIPPLTEEEQRRRSVADLLARPELKGVVSASPKIQKFFVDQLKKSEKVEKRMDEKRCKWPYYKEHFGLALLPALDSIIKDRESLTAYVKESRVTRKSLHQRIYQGFMYIIDNLDPDGIYSNLWDEVEICTSATVDDPYDGYVKIKLLEKELPSIIFKKSLPETSGGLSDIIDVVKNFIEQAPIPSRLLLPCAEHPRQFFLSEEDRIKLSSFVSNFSSIIKILDIGDKQIKLIKQVVV